MDIPSMNARACVVVSGLSERVTSQEVKEHFGTAHGNSGIQRMVTLSKRGVALIEFQNPEDATTVLAKETLLQVTGLLDMFPHEGNMATLTKEEVGVTLLEFLAKLPEFPGPQHQQSGRSQGSQGNMADLDMDPDACIVVSGFLHRANSYDLNSPDGQEYTITIQLVVFREIRTVLLELPTPEGAAKILATQDRLLEETGLRVRKIDCLFRPTLNMTTSRRQPQPLQQHQATNRSLWSKGQKPQCAGIEEKIRQPGLKRQRLEIKLQKMEKENCQQKNEIKQLKKALNQSSAYEMSSDTRGVAVIINNIRFEDMEEREGAERDTDRLREAFESLGFTARTFIDLDHAKMVATMKDQGKADHSNHDCFVCCIMSHGTTGKVFSSDDVGIDICELMKPVNAKKCPSLKGKPKLFFIQACQGEKIQRTERFDNEHDVKPVPFICIEADFFLGLATVPGYVARRDEDGAPYVKHLAKLLKDFGPTHDLSAIMAMVCDKMNEINDDKFGWISSIHSTLRKSLIFKVK